MIAQIIPIVMVVILGISFLLLLPYRKRCVFMAWQVRDYQALLAQRDSIHADLKATREQLNDVRGQRDIYQGHASNLARCMSPEYRNKRAFRKNILRLFEDYQQADRERTEFVIKNLFGESTK